jgi:predicted nucleic-acid-binding protein
VKALDTNVVVRFLVRDDEAQARTARRLVEEAERRREPLWMGNGVLLECLWVLEAAYGCRREEILDAVRALRLMAAIVCESPEAVDEFLQVAQQEKTELDDLLIGVLGRHAGCDTVLTFDPRAGRSGYFSLLKS